MVPTAAPGIEPWVPTAAICSLARPEWLSSLPVPFPLLFGNQLLIKLLGAGSQALSLGEARLPKAPDCGISPSGSRVVSASRHIYLVQ